MSETEIERNRCLAIVRLQMSDRLPIESRRLLMHIARLIADNHQLQTQPNPDADRTSGERHGRE